MSNQEGTTRGGSFDPVLLAQSFPQWEILGRFAAVSGDFGEECSAQSREFLFRVRQRAPARLALLKVLIPPPGDDQFSERFCRDARRRAGLSHSALCRVYDYGLSRGIPFLLVEHVEGVDLKQRMNMGLTPAATLTVMTQICQAVACALKSEMTGGELRPWRVLVDNRDHIKVIDFGLGRSESDRREPDMHQVLAGWFSEMVYGAAELTLHDLLPVPLSPALVSPDAMSPVETFPEIATHRPGEPIPLIGPLATRPGDSFELPKLSPDEWPSDVVCRARTAKSNILPLQSALFALAVICIALPLFAPAFMCVSIAVLMTLALGTGLLASVMGVGMLSEEFRELFAPLRFSLRMGQFRLQTLLVLMAAFSVPFLFIRSAWQNAGGLGLLLLVGPVGLVFGLGLAYVAVEVGGEMREMLRMPGQEPLTLVQKHRQAEADASIDALARAHRRE